MKGYGDQIKKLEEEIQMLRKSKNETEYFCEKHP